MLNSVETVLVATPLKSKPTMYLSSNPSHGFPLAEVFPAQTPNLCQLLTTGWICQLTRFFGFLSFYGKPSVSCEALSYILEDEKLEVTPKRIVMRKALARLVERLISLTRGREHFAGAGEMRGN